MGGNPRSRALAWARFVIIGFQLADVAELADAHDSKSCAFGRVGSIPTIGIIGRLHCGGHLSKREMQARLRRYTVYLAGITDLKGTSMFPAGHHSQVARVWCTR